jgi:hypothetical protein
VLARIESYLQALPPYIASMRQISATIGRDFRAYADDFTRSFPDYAPNTPVFFTVSLFQFDGGTRPVGNRTALLFGIDAIARFHGADTNLKVLFDHELFHQYHDQIAPELTDDDAPLWVSLWEEGLATYVSQRMNPGSTDAQVLMFPSNLAEQAAPLMRELASELRANFRSTDREEYALFFFGQKVRANWPPRSGYYVGYRIAQTLGQGHSLQEIAAWRGAPLQEAVRKALDDFAAAPVTLMPNPRS